MAQGRADLAVLAKQRQFFTVGKLTDVVIRIRITGEEPQPPPAKRQRTDQTEEAAAVTPSPAADPFTDIKAHAFVLCTRSVYFEKALREEWAEASQRRVELTVKDERELEDLKLLIKLSYSDSYTHDSDGELLPLATRLRLAVRADALESVEAVDQVVASLDEGLDVAGAIKCLDELPPALEEHEAMKAVRKGAASMLCAHLGPVAGMFVEEADPEDGRCLPLREEVKQLPPFVLKRLLASDALQLQLENEAYALLVAWLQQSPHAEDDDSDDDDEEEDEDDDKRLALFKELAPLLRYHHMTTDFLANVVCRCSMMQASGLLPTVVHSAIVQRDALFSLLKKKDMGECNRGVGASEAKWKIKATFTLEEVTALEPGKYLVKWCGLVAGYPANLQLERSTDKGDTLGAFFCIHLPGAANGSINSLDAGVGLKWTMKLSPDVLKGWDTHFFSTPKRRSWGWKDVFDKPWAEAVRGGSPHFPGGKLEIEVTVELAVKK